MYIKEDWKYAENMPLGWKRSVLLAQVAMSLDLYIGIKTSFFYPYMCI